MLGFVVSLVTIEVLDGKDSAGTKVYIYRRINNNKYKVISGRVGTLIRISYVRQQDGVFRQMGVNINYTNK